MAFVKPRYFVLLDDLAAFDETPVEFQSLVRFAGEVHAETGSTILSGTKARLLTRVLLPREIDFTSTARLRKKRGQADQLTDSGVPIAYTPYAFVPRQKRTCEKFLMVFYPLESETAPRPTIRLAKGSVPGVVIKTDDNEDVVVFAGQEPVDVEGVRTDGTCAFVSRGKAGRPVAFSAVNATLLAVGENVLCASSTTISLAARCDDRVVCVRLDAQEPTALRLRLPADTKTVWIDDTRFASNGFSHDVDTGLTRFDIAPGAHNLRAEK